MSDVALPSHVLRSTVTHRAVIYSDVADETSCGLHALDRRCRGLAEIRERHEGVK